jgi:hypothetical protein
VRVDFRRCNLQFCVVVQAVVVFVYTLEVDVVECCCELVLALLLFFANYHLLRLDCVEAHMIVFEPTCHSIDRLLSMIVDDVDEGAVREDVVCVLWMVCAFGQVLIDV